MSRKPWYKRYPSDFIAGTTMLTAEEKGVYSTIIDLLNDRGGPIEDNPADLARICGCSGPKRFQSIKQRLVKLGKLASVGDRITNARFERERSGNSSHDPPTTRLEIDPPDLLEINGLSESYSQRPEARNKNLTKRAGARTRLPEDVVLSMEMIAYAAEAGFAEPKIKEMFGAFCDHHLARGNTMSDWLAAWRTWVRNEVKFAANRNGGNHGGNRSGRSTGGNSYVALARRVRERAGAGTSSQTVPRDVSSDIVPGGRC